MARWNLTITMKINSIEQNYDIMYYFQECFKMEYNMSFKIVASFWLSVVEFCVILPYINHVFIYLFGVLRRFQHCTGHITTGSWNGRGNQYIQFVRVLYCKLPTNGKQLPAFPLQAVPETKPQPQRWKARVLPLCHRGPS